MTSYVPIAIKKHFQKKYANYTSLKRALKMLQNSYKKHVLKIYSCVLI